MSQGVLATLASHLAGRYSTVQVTYTVTAVSSAHNNQLVITRNPIMKKK